jgi:prepilin-type N-terminal cleavage/methylation domain-containing protein
MRRSRPRQRGFSLVEILAAMTLFAIVGSAMGILATQSMKRTTENRHATAAVLLAQQQIEALRALDYPNVAGSTLGATMNGQSFSIVTVVQTDVPVANTKTVTVTVSWVGPEGSKSYALPTIVTDVTAS